MKANRNSKGYEAAFDIAYNFVQYQHIQDANSMSELVALVALNTALQMNVNETSSKWQAITLAAEDAVKQKRAEYDC